MEGNPDETHSNRLESPSVKGKSPVSNRLSLSLAPRARILSRVNAVAIRKRGDGVGQQRHSSKPQQRQAAAQ